MWIRLLGRSPSPSRRTFCPCRSGLLLYRRLRFFSLSLSLLRLLLLFFLFFVFFLPTRNSFKIMQIRHPCHYFLAPPRREANFCTNLSALKINVGWRHFILKKKTIDRRPIVFRYWTAIEKTLYPGSLRTSGRFIRVHRMKNNLWFRSSTLYPVTTKL